MTINAQNDNQNLNCEGRKSSISEIPKDVKQNDLLDTRYFTDGVVDFINNADSPLLISLDGEWGIGKTSIMNTVKHELCDNDDAKFHGIWVNTWQFSLLDSSPAPQAVVRILQSIVNQIMALKPDYGKREQVSQLMGAIAAVSSGLRSASDVTGDPLFGVGKTTLGFIEKISNKIKGFFGTTPRTSSTDNAALVKQLSEEIKQLVDEVLNKSNTIKVRDICVQKYEAYNPFNFSRLRLGLCEKIVVFLCLVLCNFFTMCGFIIYYLILMIADGFGAICSYSFLLIKVVFEFICYVPKIAYTILCDKKWPEISKKDGFVFFIDDLDRIDPNLALEIVEMLASVFSFKKCIFVLAIDKRALMEVVRLKLAKRMINGDDKVNDNDEDNAIDDTKSIDEQCKQYLDRFIHISIPVSKIFYDIQPLLRESLLKISFFTPDELNDDLVILLDKVITCSIGKNPRAIKQLINSLSLLVSFELHTWKYDDEDEKSWQVKGLTKEVLFIIQCIKMNYPKVFNALSIRPYFKTWDIEFATKCFNANDPEVSKDLARQCNASNNWEYALFHICEFNNKSLSEFDKLRQIFEVVNGIFEKYMLERNVKQLESEIYVKVILDVFYYFYRIIGKEAKRGYYLEYVVKTSKEYRRKR